MNSFYADTLYPLQDKVLKIITAANSPFYLTGGTALSRFYYPYRYSDDLDFFVNTYSQFTTETDRILSLLKNITVEVITKTDSFCSIKVENVLKIDFVNDTGKCPDDFLKNQIFSKVDTIQRILANKISALLGRDDAKDIVDLWIISTHEKIIWEKIFTDISSRAAGIFPPYVAEKITTFPINLLETIKWIPGKKPDPAHVQKDLLSIADDILKTKEKIA